MIPLVDLHAQYLNYKAEIDSAIQSVISNCSFIGGEVVRSFEENFAQHMGISHCIGCANGTDSLEILLKVFGVGTGDEVIVPAISWISTSEAVSSVGATPVFVDIAPNLYTIDIASIESKITPKTKAIIPVHLYGQPVDMHAIMELAEKHQLKVIEDCAQAHDATFKEKKIGTFGHAASFSFYPGKNLGAYGDAGCMITNDSSVAEMARMIANHGQKEKHNHYIEGRNSRLDGLHAAVLNVKLKYLPMWTDLRREKAAQYNALLENSSVHLPLEIKEGKHVYHLYVIRSERRDELASFLKQNGINSAIHYPTALPFLKCYEHQGNSPDNFPVASKYQDEILSLPMFPELKQEDVVRISETILSFK